ncbi:MAG: AAA family ATPase [Bacteroidetes bacterium]|nr:AAA family ATPase [Bacteroidota bacterium]
MRIKEICIQNFRAIREQRIDAVNISMFIGNNGTGKTSVLEAIHFALSPYFLQGKIKHTDFYNGEDEPITIEIEFDSNFKVELPDGYTTQEVVCNKVHLNIKKRESRSTESIFRLGSHYSLLRTNQRKRS